MKKIFKKFKSSKVQEVKVQSSKIVSKIRNIQEAWNFVRTIERTFRWSGLALLLLFWSNQLEGQITRTKDIDKNFSGKRIVEVQHRYGDLMVKKSEDNTVKVKMEFLVEAKTEEDVNKILDHLNVDFQEEGDRLTITTEFETKKWTMMDGISFITFKNGTKVKNIKEFNLRFVLFIPELEELSLANKYNGITIEEDIATNLNVKLHSGKLNMGNLEGNANLEGKYSKMRLKSINGNMNVDIYDGDIQMENAKRVNLKSKYSDISIKSVEGLLHDSYDDNVEIESNSGELKLTSKYSEYEIGGASQANINSYDDKFKIGDINGELVLQTKYSDFKVGTFSNARIDSHDDDFIGIGSPNAVMMVKSKYSVFGIETLQRAEFESSYDDKLEIGNLGAFKANAKYSEVIIGKIEGPISLVSHNDNIKIRQLNSDFKSVDFLGKYTTLDIKMSANTKYHLSADLTHGKITFPESNFEKKVYINEGGETKVEGNIQGASGDSPKITITDAYDCKINIKN